MPDDITLHTTFTQQMTCVSNTFIDQYMAEADGEYVKIYLYLLRALSRPGITFSMARMGDDLAHTERDLKKALLYWQEKKLLRIEYDADRNPVGICLLDPDREVKSLSIHVTGDIDRIAEADSTISTQEATVDREPEVPKNDVPEFQSFSSDERKLMTKDASTRELIFVTEQYLGKPLSQKDADFVLFWRYTLGLSNELIEYLVDQSVNSGHPSMHYMNAIAISWKKEGILTEADARAKDSIHSETYYTIMKHLGISGRKLTPEEQQYIKRWTQEFHFADDIIAEACERTIRGTGKASFSYADKILSSWSEASVKKLSDIAELDTKHGKKDSKPRVNTNNNFKNFSERSYTDEDFDELEMKLLNIK